MLHYLAAMIIMPIYSIQVCPFIEDLEPIKVIIPVIVVLSLQYAARRPLTAAMVGSRPLKYQSANTFRLEIALFTLSAVVLAVYNNLIYSFPLESGLKILLGISALGFFAAVDLALEQERRVAQLARESGLHLDPDEDHFSLTSKAALFTSISLTLVVSIFMLLVIKDLTWLSNVSGSVTLDEARTSIIKEFLFAFAVIMPHTLNIILSYSKNLRSFFDAENRVLREVSAGNLSGSVPVASNDEFGIMAKHTNLMVNRIRQHTEEIMRTRDTTILTLASLAETRDNETGAHILRTQRYVKILAEHLRGSPRFSEYLNEESIDLLYKSAPLHDIGKVGIPDAILLKPGKLTEEEFEIMKTHAEIGTEALNVAEAQLGSTDFLKLAREISLSHHEKWDGSGYPRGLSCDDIPISGRLMAVADVYDALISKRIYKPAFSHKKSMEIILEGSGKHFDPDVIDALTAREEDFKEIARIYKDEAYGTPQVSQKTA
jgi:HD-GYP domain-containing protein (c-di-GMP phosphodiesterase class II)